MNFKDKTIRKFNDVKFKAEKNSDKIALAGTIIFSVVAVGTAIWATTKAKKVMDAHREGMDEIRQAVEVADEGEYTDKDRQQDTVIQYVQTGVTLLKLYAPTIIFTGLTIGSACYGHKILTTRNAALAGSLAFLRKEYDDYRGRVINELGSESDEHFRYGTEEKTVTETETVIDKKGKEKQVEKEKKVSVPTKGDMYSVVIDEYSNNSDDMSYLMLRARLLEVNNQLRIKGHLSYNRILEYLHLPETNALAAGIIDDSSKSDAERYIQIKGMGMVRENAEGSLYFDDSTEAQDWYDYRTRQIDSIIVRFDNIQDNIADDMVRTDSSVQVIA